MAKGLTNTEKFFRRIEALALSTLPITELTAACETDTHHDGVMVALVPEDPGSLAVEGESALPADDLHVTLCYLGKVQDLSNFDKTRILSETRRVCDEIGRTFSTTADGVIVMGQNDDGVPATALLVQSDDIVRLYNGLSEALNYRSDYPSFIPHMTTGYGVPVEEAETKVGQQIDFANVIVKFGDDVHVIPLTSSLVAAPRSVNVIDRVIDSLGRLWDEALHPRDGEGKFIKKNGAVSGKLHVPNRDRKGVRTIDANRASVVGFHTFDNDVWVLAEITDSDGTKVQGFAKAVDVRATAPVKARLDALYPIDDHGDAFINSSLERKRQLDLVLAHITKEYGRDNDSEGAEKFLKSLGFWEKDLDYIWGGGDESFLDGMRRVDRDLDADELDEQADIIEDAKTVKELRDRVHGLRSDADQGFIVDESRKPADFDSIGATWRDNDATSSAKDAFRNLAPDDYVVVYHGTKNKEHLDALLETGRVNVPEGYESDLPTAARDSLYVAPTRADAAQYGEHVVAIRVQKKDLSPSPEALRSKSDVDVTTALFNSFDGAILPPGYELNIVSEADSAHVPPTQKLLTADTPDLEVVNALKGGADPLTLSTNNLLGAMEESGRFDKVAPEGATGVSPIAWYVDPNDPTGNNVKLAGVKKPTSNRAFFTKQSVIGAEFGNTDIVNEITVSLIAESMGDDDSRLLRVPRSVFGDNPEWDGTNPPGSGDLFNEANTHQPGHVVSQHAQYLIPSNWNTTDIASEELSLRNDIRDLDPAGQVDQTEAFYEDIGDVYGHDIAKLILLDFLILNGDRNPGNAVLATSPDGSQSAVIPIDHGFAFDEPFVEGDSAGSFDWFMNYQFTKAWRNYVVGGLRLNDSMTDESLRETVEGFIDGYSGLSVEAILSKFRAMPGVSDEQVERVEASIKGSVDRLDWMRNNIDAVLRGLSGK